MDNDNSFFQPGNCTVDHSPLHFTEGRLKKYNLRDLLVFLASFNLMNGQNPQTMDRMGRMNPQMQKHDPESKGRIRLQR